MSLNRNLAVTIVGQGAVGAIGILSIPLLLKVLGSESYSLAVLFVTFQAWIALLDLGLGQVVARETVRYSAGAVRDSDFRKLLTSAQTIFVGAALVVSIASWWIAPWVASAWLTPKELPIETVSLALALMAIGASLRWASAIYRGVATAYERFTWLAGFNLLTAILRYLLVLPLLTQIDTEKRIIAYFIYQIGVSAFEFVGLAYKARVLVGRPLRVRYPRIYLESLKAERSFLVSITLASLLWVIMTQSDRLVMSRILDLQQFGFFAFAVASAAAISMLTTAVGSVVLPRLTHFATVSDARTLERVYVALTVRAAVIMAPAAVTLVFCTEYLLVLWTGDPALSAQVGHTVALYVAGNALLGLNLFVYYVQYAKKDMSAHVVGNLLFVLLLVPLQIVLAHRYGFRGAGYAWLTVNIVYLLAWTPVVHARMGFDRHLRWLLVGVLGPVLLAVAAGATAKVFLWLSGAVESLITVGVVAAASYAATLGYGYVFERHNAMPLTPQSALPVTDAR